MKIDMKKFHNIWLVEDGQGNKYTKIFTENGDINEPFPKQYKYQCSSFPNEFREEILRLVNQEEVDRCDHPKNKINRQILHDGTEKRECLKCGGRQNKNSGEDWSDKWDGYGSRRFFTSTRSWNNSLVTAIVRSNDYDVTEAIRIVSSSCEKCLNILYDKYGFDCGYKEGSEEWFKV